jgi:hypothetical protein
MRTFSSAFARRIAALGLLGAAIAAGGAGASCGGETADGAAIADGGDGRGDADGGQGPQADVPLVPASKVDVLLVVDDSASMGDKGMVLASSLKTLLAEVSRTNDVHLGVVSSSLGSMGGDVCPDDGVKNGSAHLHTRGANGADVAAAKQGFLAFGGGPGATSDLAAFARDAEDLVRGVGEAGCGLEAQLESAYRFLVQPDPWQKVTLDGNNQAALTGLDATVLAQRAAFLRPDSLVVVLLVTDEDDSNVDPRSVGGQGWAFAANQFPGSTVFRADGKSTTAPRATSACKTNPGAADCTSCGFALSCDPSTPECQKLKSDPECQKNGGYYGPTEDPINVRFHRMKERYGIDPQFPLSRYVDGFTNARIPDRSTEHVETTSGSRRTIGAYAGTPKCTNPLFAATLPSSPGDELCNLPRGPRSRELVVFAVLGGVVPGLVASATPAWAQILGSNPDAFDYSGIDPHMIPSALPRAGLASPSATRGDNGADPVHGREWDTRGNDLQYACTFALPQTRTCTSGDPSCDCALPDMNPPLCGTTLGAQARAKAYPSPRPLRVAKALGDRAVVGSVCAAGAQGYEATMQGLGKRLVSRIAL